MLLLLSLLMSLRFFVMPMAYEADTILGTYFTEDKSGQIEFFRKGNRFYGKVVAGERIGPDVNNPDPALRQRSTLGMEFISDFEFDGKGNYINGTIYNSDDGKTYKGKIWLEEEGRLLKMRGYLGFFYKTVTWERVPD